MKPEASKSQMVGGLVILVFILAAAISGIINSLHDQPTTTADAPLTLTQRLGPEIRGHFTRETTFDYSGPDLTITVPDYNASTAYNLKLTVGEFYKWAYTTDWVPFQQIDINIWTNSFRDGYGQTQHLRVAYVLLSRDTARHFNWDNVYYPDAWNLYDRAILNPAVSW